MLVDIFPQKKYFSAIFDFHFRENPPFRDEFQALTGEQGVKRETQEAVKKHVNNGENKHSRPDTQTYLT